MKIIYILLFILHPIIPAPVNYQRPTEIHITYDDIGNRLQFEWQQHSGANVVWVSKEINGYISDVVIESVIPGEYKRSIVDSVLPASAIYRMYECFYQNNTYVWCIQFESEFYFINPKSYKTFLPLLTIS